MAFRLATGDLICNVDADNFTGQGFASYLSSTFYLQKGIFLAAGRTSTDTLGRICVNRSSFFEIRGYDESMTGYGFEDLDFVNRLQTIGLKRVEIDNPDFLTVVRHGDWERICNKPEAKLLDSILVRQIDHASSKVIFLLSNGNLHAGTVLENACLNASDPFNELTSITYPYEYSLQEGDWQDGVWRENATELVLAFGEKRTTLLLTGCFEHYLVCGQDKFFIIRPGGNLVEEGLFFYSQLSNRGIMIRNAKPHGALVNPGSFGKGVVTRNFDSCLTIA
jgi:hypothetical protein